MVSDADRSSLNHSVILCLYVPLSVVSLISFIIATRKLWITWLHVTGATNYSTKMNIVHPLPGNGNGNGNGNANGLVNLDISLGHGGAPQSLMGGMTGMGHGGGVIGRHGYGTAAGGQQPALASRSAAALAALPHTLTAPSINDTNNGGGHGAIAVITASPIDGINEHGHGHYGNGSATVTTTPMNRNQQHPHHHNGGHANTDGYGDAAWSDHTPLPNSSDSGHGHVSTVTDAFSPSGSGSQFDGRPNGSGSVPTNITNANMMSNVGRHVQYLTNTNNTNGNNTMTIPSQQQLHHRQQSEPDGQLVMSNNNNNNNKNGVVMTATANMASVRWAERRAGAPYRLPGDDGVGHDDDDDDLDDNDDIEKEESKKDGAGASGGIADISSGGRSGVKRLPSSTRRVVVTADDVSCCHILSYVLSQPLGICAILLAISSIIIFVVCILHWKGSDINNDYSTAALSGVAILIAQLNLALWLRSLFTITLKLAVNTMSEHEHQRYTQLLRLVRIIILPLMVLVSLSQLTLQVIAVSQPIESRSPYLLASWIPYWITLLPVVILWSWATRSISNMLSKGLSTMSHRIQRDRLQIIRVLLIGQKLTLPIVSILLHVSM
jgi:hypothetical protein